MYIKTHLVQNSGMQKVTYKLFVLRSQLSSDHEQGSGLSFHSNPPLPSKSISLLSLLLSSITNGKCSSFLHSLCSIKYYSVILLGYNTNLKHLSLSNSHPSSINKLRNYLAMLGRNHITMWCERKQSKNTSEDLHLDLLYC